VTTTGGFRAAVPGSQPSPDSMGLGAAPTGSDPAPESAANQRVDLGAPHTHPSAATARPGVPPAVAVVAPVPEESVSSDEVLVGEAVRDAITALVERLVEREAGVRQGDDPEDVHQARVAVRWLRSVLRTFGDVLEAEWATALRDELRWLGRLLGDVRDAEVLRDRLQSQAGWSAAEDRPVVKRLIGRLNARRNRARARLIEQMTTDRYRSLVDALDAAAREPALLPEVAAVPADVALRPGLQKLWKHLDDAIERVVTEGATDEALHVVRIRSKRVRYAAEAVTPVFGKPARRFAKAASALQDVLGEHQDAVVARAWLRRAAATTPDAAFVAGELAALQASSARSARAKWPAAWRSLSRKKLRFWS
jgi:CHAD domain-containing protein